ncbi:MAG: TauD/TfdA dioxygenase family protein [Candidatus Baltobacteraceae bacterium]
MATTSTVQIQPSGAALGADISAVDIGRDIDRPAMDAILAAWSDHLVLRFRRQTLSDNQLVAFSRRFGTLDLAPITTTGKPWLPEYPELNVISNVIDDNGRPIGGLGAGESEWHTDMSYKAEPPSASILYSLEVPAAAGNTEFSNMYLAAEELPADLRSAITGRLCKHDSSMNSTGQLRKNFAPVTDPRDAPGVAHPMLRTHPVTKRTALFLGRRKNAYIVGLPLTDSEALLDRLWAHATQTRYVWQQNWRVGDLIIWDNRCVMHRRDAFDPNLRRVLHRAQVAGDKPF